MTIKIGDQIPDGVLGTMTSDGPTQLSSDEIFAGKKVVVFSVPGAFTPTCSAKHLPGFVARAGELKAKGVDVIACLSVNDAFVMGAWAQAQGADDHILMLADGNATFTKALGLEMDASGFGMGIRGQRFSMLVDNGKVTLLNIEEPGAFNVSSAEYMLGQL